MRALALRRFPLWYRYGLNHGKTINETLLTEKYQVRFDDNNPSLQLHVPAWVFDQIDSLAQRMPGPQPSPSDSDRYTSGYEVKRVPNNRNRVVLEITGWTGGYLPREQVNVHFPPTTLSIFIRRGQDGNNPSRSVTRERVLKELATQFKAYKDHRRMVRKGAEEQGY